MARCSFDVGDVVVRIGCSDRFVVRYSDKFATSLDFINPEGVLKWGGFWEFPEDMDMKYIHVGKWDYEKGQEVEDDGI